MKHVSRQGPSRRTMLRSGALAGTAATLSCAGLLTAGTARAATAAGGGDQGLPYPSSVTDTSHATPEVAEIFRGFFTAKSEHDIPALMSYFSTTNSVYLDASLGVPLLGWQEINTEFSNFAGLPAAAISYPTRIVGDARSATVELVDTPQFFGKELRSLSSVTFDGSGKIIRWVDYWDGRSSLWPNTIASSYPADFSDAEQNADPAVVRAATSLQAAFAAGAAAAAVALMSPDVVHEDLSAHTRVRGQFQAQRYYTRALAQLPYGQGAALLHADGSSRGGGYEWSAASAASPLRRGHTAIELDRNGRISLVSVMYDSSVLSYSAYQSLVGLAAEAPLS